MSKLESENNEKYTMKMTVGKGESEMVLSAV